MSIFKKWFNDNPSKILGEVVKMKNWRSQEGELIDVVVGGIENLQKIDAPESFVPKKGIGLHSVNTKEVTAEIEEKNIKKALDAFEVKKAKSKGKPKATKSKKKVNLEKVRYFPARTDIELTTFEESFEELNKGLDEGYIKAWVFYKKSNNFPLHKSFDKFYETGDEYVKDAMEKGFLCYDPKEGFIPSVLYYSGNIYTRLNRLQNDYKASAEKSIEQHKKQKEKLKSILPEKLKLNAPDENKLNINFQSLFAKKFRILQYGEESSLYDAFFNWIFNLDITQLKYFKLGEPTLLYKHTFLKDQFRDREKSWVAQYKRESVDELNYQMNVFIQTLDSKSQLEIENKWNREHNGFVEPNYKLIPICFEHNKLFKDAPLEVRDAQIEGVQFMDVSGNGIIAYDVGVGKTMTSILALGNGISNGQCKRPIIAVPNSTYWKWLAELHGTYDSEGNVISHGILPQYKINNFYNLGKDIMSEIWNPETGLNEAIEENSITMITYDAFKHLGFSESLSDTFVVEVADIVSQTEGISTRERAKEFDKAVEIVSVAESEGKVFIDQADFDYMVLDEAHNCNKIFTQVQNNDDTEGGRTYTLKQGEPRVRSLVPFFLSRYIQRNNLGRNICLLTATPFNNNPLEVYSILALADLDRIKKLGVGNIRVFFDEYIFTTSEKVVKAGNKIDTQQVVKGWNNKISLQSIMFAVMNYKTGEDANIVRPIKHTFPKISEVDKDGIVTILPAEKQIKTYLLPTDRQKANFMDLDNWFDMAKKDSELKAGADLVMITKGMSNTFSPHSYEYSKDDNIPYIDPIDFIEDSAKLKYTMLCIKSILEHHKKTKTPIGGIIIYSNTGVPFFPLIKEYLENELDFKKEGYKPKKKWYSQVEIIAGGINSTDKENIKEGFLKGDIKVVIGSATIREGIDLQKRTTTLFNLYNEWNPTAYKQLEGRLYRFGNIYKNVRIVTPLLIDSSDAMIWQKLEEKTGRINDIFDRNDKSNILEVIEEDREAIKWSIMQDTEAIAKEKIKEEIQEVESKLKIKMKQADDIKSLYNLKNEKLPDARIKINQYEKEDFNKYDPAPDLGGTYIDKYERISNIKYDIMREMKSEIEELEKAYKENEQVVLGVDDLTKIGKAKNYFKVFRDSFFTSKTDLKAYYNAKSKYDKILEFIIQTFGKDMVDNHKFIFDSINEEIKEINEVELPALKSQSYIDEVKAEIDAERERLQAGANTLEETVKAFTDTNYLLDELAKKPESPEQKKAKLIKDYKDAIEGMYLMMGISEGETKEKYNEAIELMELSLNAI